MKGKGKQIFVTDPSLLPQIVKAWRDAWGDTLNESSVQVDISEFLFEIKLIPLKQASEEEMKEWEKAIEPAIQTHVHKFNKFLKEKRIIP